MIPVPSMSLHMPQFILLYNWVKSHCIHVPHLLYPFNCWFCIHSSRLVPYLGYCELWNNKKQICKYLCGMLTKDSLGRYSESTIVPLLFSENLPQWPYQLIFISTVNEGSSFIISSLALAVIWFLNDSHSGWVRMNIYVVLTCVSPELSTLNTF